MQIRISECMQLIVLCLYKGHKTKCNKMEDDRKRQYTLIFK